MILPELLYAIPAIYEVPLSAISDSMLTNTFSIVPVLLPKTNPNCDLEVVAVVPTLNTTFLIVPLFSAINKPA